MRTMIKLISVISLCAIVGFTKADYCQDNFTLGELPGGILKEALSVIITGTIADFLGCPDDIAVPDRDVKFWYYSRSNPEVPILLHQKYPFQLDPSKPTKVIIPGWLCNVTNDRMPELRAAYLKREDCNVIGIDWTARSIDLYSNSFCSVPGVAKIIGAFLCNLNAVLHVDLTQQLHIVGHSLGGQISGLTGQEVKRQCNQIVGRVTGLDPAGPLYQLLSPSDRLDASDAAFVDVIHTNQAFFGFYGPCGDADFFPNCGTFQPGCLRIDSSTTIENIIDLPVGVVGCNHLRSLDYMVESINPGNITFRATSCAGCPGLPIVGPCLEDFFNPKQTVMGEECPRNPPAYTFSLPTNNKPPFALG